VATKGLNVVAAPGQHYIFGNDDGSYIGQYSFHRKDALVDNGSFYYWQPLMCLLSMCFPAKLLLLNVRGSRKPADDKDGLIPDQKVPNHKAIPIRTCGQQYSFYAQWKNHRIHRGEYSLTKANSLYP